MAKDIKEFLNEIEQIRYNGEEFLESSMKELLIELDILDVYNEEIKNQEDINTYFKDIVLNFKDSFAKYDNLKGIVIDLLESILNNNKELKTAASNKLNNIVEEVHKEVESKLIEGQTDIELDEIIKQVKRKEYITTDELKNKTKKDKNTDDDHDDAEKDRIDRDRPIIFEEPQTKKENTLEDEINKAKEAQKTWENSHDTVKRNYNPNKEERE